MKNVLPEIINNCQTGFLKGRYIGENIRLLFDILEHVNETNIPACLIFADFEKAFDSLDHNFLKKTLSAFNFGDGQSCVYNNGRMSDFFKIERGVRQGCPLSPYLFIISIEILSHIIRYETDIKGVKLVSDDIKKNNVCR